MMISLFWQFERSSIPAAPLLFMALLALPGFVGAEEGAVTLVNRTEQLFVYVTFTEEEWQQRGAILWVSDPAGLFQRAGAPLGYVSAGGVRRQPLEGPSRVAGYLMHPESAEWPLLRLTAAPGERVTISQSDLSERRLPADQLPAIDEPILLDGRFADWEPRGSLVTLRSGYEPERFVRERSGERVTLSVEESVGWGSGGTRLEELKAIPAGEAVYLFFRWRDPPSAGSRLLLYLYGESRRRPVGTLLIEPSEESGGVALYRPGFESPVRVGNFLRRENAVEAEVRLQEMALPKPRFAVVSTLYRGEEWYEEFPITRVVLDELID